MVPEAMSSSLQDDQMSLTLATAISPRSNTLLLTKRLLLFSHPLLDLTSHNNLSDFPAEVSMLYSISSFVLRIPRFCHYNWVKSICSSNTFNGSALSQLRL